MSSTVTHKWRRRPTAFFGEVWVPFAHIELNSHKGVARTVLMQIESVAVISLLRRSMARLLGVELEQGRRTELSSVGNRPMTAFIHTIETGFGVGMTFEVPFAVAVKEDVPNLLGRLGVFDRLNITFCGPLQETRIETFEGG